MMREKRGLEERVESGEERVESGEEREGAR